MQNQEQNQQFFRALNAGLTHFEDRDVRVRSDLVDDIANLKGIVRAILNGQLVLASPDQIKEDKPPQEGE